jgi:hypothetical protein
MAKENMPLPIRVSQLEFLGIVNRAVNDGHGMAREIYEMSPSWITTRGFDTFVQTVCVLVDRGALMPMKPFRPDSYLELTPYALWMLGEIARPKHCRGRVASYLHSEGMTNATA